MWWETVECGERIGTRAKSIDYPGRIWKAPKKGFPVTAPSPESVKAWSYAQGVRASPGCGGAGGAPAASDSARPIGSILRLHARFLHQLGGRGDVVAKIFFEFLGRHRQRVLADLRQPLLHGRKLQRLLGFLVELADDVARGLGRHENPVPERVGRVLQAGLRSRRHVGQRGGALGGADRE